MCHPYRNLRKYKERFVKRSHVLRLLYSIQKHGYEASEDVYGPERHVEYGNIDLHRRVPQGLVTPEFLGNTHARLTYHAANDSAVINCDWGAVTLTWLSRWQWQPAE